jgi:hypothetical protein
MSESISERIMKVNNPDKFMDQPDRPPPGTIVEGKKKVIEYDSNS